MTAGPTGVTSSGTFQKTVKAVDATSVVWDQVHTDADGHASHDESTMHTDMITNGLPPSPDDNVYLRDVVRVPLGSYKAIAVTSVGGGGTDTSWYVAGTGMVKQLWVHAMANGTQTDVMELIAYHP